MKLRTSEEFYVILSGSISGFPQVSHAVSSERFPSPLRCGRSAALSVTEAHRRKSLRKWLVCDTALTLTLVEVTIQLSVLFGLSRCSFSVCYIVSPLLCGQECSCHRNTLNRSMHRGHRCKWWSCWGSERIYISSGMFCSPRVPVLCFDLRNSGHAFPFLLALVRARARFLGPPQFNLSRRVEYIDQVQGRSSPRPTSSTGRDIPQRRQCLSAEQPTPAGASSNWAARIGNLGRCSEPDGS